MQKGICLLSIIPQRLNDSDTAEMVNQLLFGDIFEIIEKKQNWLNIRCIDDNYEGWIDVKQAYLLSDEQYNSLKKCPKLLCKNILEEISCMKIGLKQFLVLGSSMPINENGEIEIDNNLYAFEGETIKKQTFDSETLVYYAKKYLNVPYLWGGRSPFGIDCSGFSQMVYKICGIQIPRDASQQAKCGDNVTFISEAKTGDLAFFDNEDGSIIHVGILLNNNEIIHSSGMVKIEHIDNHGIINHQTNKYSHKLRLIKRIVNDKI